LFDNLFSNGPKLSGAGGFVKKILITTLSIVLFALFGCQSKPSQEIPRPKVIVSMAPYKTFVDIIGDGKLDVICLVPKGTNPHVYETPPQLIEEALKAKLWLCIGEPGEKKFAEVFIKRSPGMRFVDLSKGLPLCGETCSHSHHDHAALDKHIWLSPRLAKIQAATICEALCDLLPDDAPLFRHRLHAFQEKLQTLDNELSSFFATRNNHLVLITHPSLAYFCRDYGLEQIAIEIEGKEPLPKDVEHIFEAVRSHHIDRILIQPQHPTKGALRIAEELKLGIKTIDPYEEDYFTNLRSIAYAIGK
jgi:zinc transport system substrate-binding protein